MESCSAAVSSFIATAGRATGRATYEPKRVICQTPQACIVIQTCTDKKAVPGGRALVRADADLQARTDIKMA